ncbi:hypothetical protein LCGC14_2008790, partial [marine sediment metagenome]
ASERSEKPTAQRLRKARREGKVAQSAEVPSAMMVAALLIVLAVAGPILYRWVVSELRSGLSCSAEARDAEDILTLLNAKAARLLAMLLPFLLAGLGVSAFGGLLVGGWAFAPKSVNPNLSRISPVAGLKNLVSLGSLVRLLTSLAKLALILIIVYLYLRDRMEGCLALRWASSKQILLAVVQLVFGLMLRIGGALLAVGVADAFFQRWKFRRDLRMTRQEVKEETKEHEVSPQVRSRIRSLQMSMSRKRMLKDVPEADLVVVNPTHVAVALKYDAGAMDAPHVVAKGADFMAEKIREIADANGVPIIRRPELARTLHDTVDVGQAVPEALFVAVAELLAMIYRLRRKRSNPMGGNPPNES